MRSRGRFWAWWHPPLHPRRGIYTFRPSLPLYKRRFLRLPLVWRPDTPVLRARGRRGFRLFGPFIFSRSGLQGCPNDGLTTMADSAYCFSLGTIKLKPGAIDRPCPRALTRRRLWRASCRLHEISRLYIVCIFMEREYINRTRDVIIVLLNSK